jgi:hypothetical protein
MLGVLSVTVALVSARLRIAREGRERERLVDERLERIEQAQKRLLRRTVARRRAPARSRSKTAPTRVGGRALLKK